MDVSEAIVARRSVRDFGSSPIDRTTITTLIAAAIQAPSAMNEQPWVFSVIQEQPLLDRISEAAKAHMLQDEAVVGTASAVRQMLSDPAFHIFYHAPALIVISAKGGGRWGVEDCSLAAENLMLTACAVGLGSCWIGFAQTWLATREGRAALQIAVDDLPVAPIIIGKPRSNTPPAARRPAEIRWVAA
jgi:nitroreductase